MTLWIVIPIVLALTFLAMHATRAIRVTAPYVVLLYGLGVCFAAVGFTVYSSLQEQRVTDQCEYSVLRSAGNRAQHLAIAYELRQAGLDEVADRLVEQLDINLPDRSIEECQS